MCDDNCKEVQEKFLQINVKCEKLHISYCKRTFSIKTGGSSIKKALLASSTMNLNFETENSY